MPARWFFFLIAGWLLHRIELEWTDLHHAAPGIAWPDFHSVLWFLKQTLEVGPWAVNTRVDSWAPLEGWLALSCYGSFMLTPGGHEMHNSSLCLLQNVWLSEYFFKYWHMNDEEGIKKCIWCRHLTITNDFVYFPPNTSLSGNYTIAIFLGSEVN